MFDFFHDKCKDISTVVVVLTVKVGSHYGHCGQVSCCCCVLRKYLSQYWGGRGRVGGNVNNPADPHLGVTRPKHPQPPAITATILGMR